MLNTALIEDYPLYPVSMMSVYVNHTAGIAAFQVLITDSD
jgi:hypothetical protein